MRDLENFLIGLKEILDFPLITLGKTPMTAWSILLFFVLLGLLFYVTARLKTWIVERLLAKSRLDIGLRHTFAAMARYVLIAIGFMVILQTAGIDLSALAIVIGSLSIGIGLGLQNITNNFVSGLILLFERPIKVGDRIEIGQLQGEVTRIAARATTIITNDNIAVIVPNSELTSSAVINWSYPSPRVRLNFPIGVAYGSDPETVKSLLLEIAENHPGVLKDAKPDVLLTEFADSSLNFMLRVWTTSYVDRPGVLEASSILRSRNYFARTESIFPSPNAMCSSVVDLCK
ncbi:mechanosensitive ion channel [bacterium]|nr:mechanosensitive ion channel [bacterium]MCI0607162.1 mechanosensitive ion channel [bacterium]